MYGSEKTNEIGSAPHRDQPTALSASKVASRWDAPTVARHFQWRVPSLAALVSLLAFGPVLPALAQIKVVTTTTGLADIARQIGGTHVDAQSIMRGPEDMHNVSPKPSYVMNVKKADLFIHSGLDAENWAPLLVKSARNPKLLAGQPGNVDASRGIALKEVPSGGQLTRALGDIHVFGNTHYALDPLNGIIIGRTILEALKLADPAHAGEFDSNYASFSTKMRDVTARLEEKMKPYRGMHVVTYHRAWPYLLDRFGLVAIGEVEPKPGISPGPKHLSDLGDTMKAQGAKVVLVEAYNSREIAETVATRAGGKAVVLAQDVKALPEVQSYEQLFEYDVDKLIEAFKETGAPPASPESGH